MNITWRVLTEVEAGSIVLLHDSNIQTAQSVRDIIEGLKEKDFVCLNLTQMLGQPYGGNFL